MIIERKNSIQED